MLEKYKKCYNGNNSKKKENEAHKSQENINGIFKLNFDCLVHIISFLNLKDLANLDKASDNFKPITENSYKKYKNLDCKTVGRITVIKGKTVINQIGRYLTSIAIDRNDFISEASVNSFLKLVAVRCSKLEEISIKFMDVDTKMLKKFNIFSRLKSIELINCGIDDDEHNDRIKECLETAIFLEKLNLSYNTYLTGRCISNIMNLVSLNLDSCQNFQNFSNVFRNNNCLVQLNIANCHGLTLKLLNEITKNLLNLEELTISSCYNDFSSSHLSEFANLSKLNKLKIQFNSISVNIDDLLLKLAEKDQLKFLDISFIQNITKKTIEALASFSKLEILKINFSQFSFDDYVKRQGNLKEMYLTRCYNVTTDGVMQLVENSPHITVLDIRGCYGITCDFYDRISTFLKEQNRPQRLTVFANQTRIKQNEIHPEVIAENQPWIQLNFEKTIELSADTEYNDTGNVFGLLFFAIYAGHFMSSDDEFDSESSDESSDDTNSDY